MKFLFPKSLVGQMITLTLIAIVTAQIIGFLIFADERRFALRAAAHQQVLTHASSIIRVLSITPKNIHEEIINGASVEGFYVALDRKPSVQRHKGQLSAIMLQRHLKKMLGSNVEAVRVQLYRDNHGWLHFNRWGEGWRRLEEDNRWNDSDDHDDDHDDDHRDGGYDADDEPFNYENPGYDKHKKMGFLQELSISVRLSSGQWLNIDSLVPPASLLWALPSLMAMIVTAVSLIIVVIVMMRRVSKPMAELATAAEKLGRGDGLEKLTPSGPSDVRKATDAFNLMQQRLDRFVKDRTEMLAAISHDLRTPITSLRIRVEFVEDQALREKMLVTIDEMQRMTEATLAFAKQDADTEVSLKTDLYALLDSLVADAVETGADATIQGDKDVVMMCRPLSLKRLFRNLMENAIRYGGNVKVNLYQSKHSIFVVIEDDGPGVSADKLDQIFEPFYRLDEARNVENGSVGLGLAISRSIVHAHGGEIFAENKTPQGLSIKVEFPQFR